jgi:alpha-beta hydrolase superfamily lysophospholipase
MSNSRHNTTPDAAANETAPKGWIRREGSFRSTDDALTLFEVCWHREDWRSPSALIIFHGFGDHSGRYAHFPEHCGDCFDALFSFDHRGHGRSEGTRGYAPSIDLLVEDSVKALRKAEKELSDRFGRSELHLLAHSMGGLIALAMLIKYPDLPLKSVTLSSPLLGLIPSVRMAKAAAAMALSKLFRGVRIPSVIDITLLTHDKGVLQMMIEDPLCHGRMTPALFISILKALGLTRRFREELPYPILFLAALEDSIVDARRTLRFHDRLKCTDKKLITYQHAYHEIFNEGGGPFKKEEAFRDLRQWLSTH